MKTICWLQRTCLLLLLLLLLLLVSSSILAFDDDGWMRFDGKIGRMSHMCGDGYLCRNIYLPTTSNLSAAVVDLQNRPWNTDQVISPHMMHDIELMKAICHCDEECALYGDCCWDAAVRFATKTEFGDYLDVNAWQCLPLQKKDNLGDELVSMFMVGRCPEGSAGADLVAMCERVSIKDEDYFYLMDIPVLSLDTNRTYANIFCAQCHSDGSNLKQWTVRNIDCNRDEDEITNQFNITIEDLLRQSSYVRAERKWRFHAAKNGQNNAVECSIIIEELESVVDYVTLYGGRRCVAKVRSCALDWPDPRDEELCRAYSLYVEERQDSSSPKGSVTYNNRHCARCNYVETNATICFKRPPRFFIRLYTHVSGKNTVSFSLIFDFKLGGVGNKVGHLRKCQNNEIWDHLHSRCHAIICGSLYENVDGECRIRANPTDGWMDPDINSSPTNFKRMNSSCQRLTLTSQEFYLLANDSVVVNQTGEMFDANQYEMEPGSGNVQICADASVQDYFDYDAVQNYLSDVCLGISVICLALHIGLHASLPKLRNLPGKNLLSLSCALFVAQTIFLTCIRSTSIGGLCAFLGALTHWSYLAAFFWMNVMGYDICKTFTGKIHRPGRRDWTFRFYSAYAWGCPTLIVAVGVLLDLNALWPDYAPSYGSHLCWISNRSGLGLFFVAPVTLLLVQNVILFIMTVRSIWSQRKAAQFAVDKNQTYRPPSSKENPASHRRTGKSNDSEKNRVRFLLYIKLALIMGLAWGFGFIAALARIPALWYPFIFFNALQGAFIFIAFDCKKKIWFLIYLQAMKKPHPATIRSKSQQKSVSVGSSQRTTTMTTTTTTTTTMAEPKTLNVDLQQSHPATNSRSVSESQIEVDKTYPTD